MKIAVSILAVDKSKEEETLEKINNTDADLLHIDVTDNTFVPTISPNWEHLYASIKPLSVHLMVSRPFDYITKYSLLNTDVITIQCELEDDIKGLLEYIRSSGIKCGLAISPDTSLDKLDGFLDILDEVLILSVQPGRGGQKFITDVLYKVDELVKLREENGYKYKIVIDGGVNDETIKYASKADIVVCGSFITNSDNYQEQIDKLRL